MNLDLHQDFQLQRPFTVYGGGHWTPADPEWELAGQVGEELALRGFTVVTGGYGGTMEAVSAGARRKGGEAVGVVHEPVDVRPPNPHLTHVHHVADYLERLAILVRVPHALALSGKSGTLAELVVASALLRRFEGRSLALWEPWWRPRVQEMLTELDPAALKHVRWVATLDDIKRHLDSVVG